VTDRFGYRVSQDGRVFVTFRGRHVVTVAGAKGERLAAALAGADGEQEQLLLAKATGNFKRGNERRVNG
jgi:hypothetical protein